MKITANRKMNTDPIARIIYAGLKKHNMSDVFDCPFDELPRDFKAQLLTIAASIPMNSPYKKLEEFKAWQAKAGGYQIVDTVNRFYTMENDK